MKDISVVELSNAMNAFVKGLPEVDQSIVSTLSNEVILDQKKIIIFAQKTKSKKGMCWDIYFRESYQ